MTKNQIGQYFNIDGILLNLKSLFKLHKIKPDLHVNSISELNLQELKNKNKIDFIVFDKDNTLTLPHENELANKEIIDKIKEFKNVFGDKNLSILSNSAGSLDDKDYKEANIIEYNTGLKVIRHDYKKPKVFKEILENFDLNNYENIDTDYKQICIIGDRLLVDVLMGKEYGFFTILVNPITLEKDNFVVRKLRKLENFLLGVNKI